MSQTFTICTYPIVAALKAASYFLKRIEWTPKNKTQREFLKLFWEPCHPEIDGLKEIQAIASTECHIINQFLRDHGFDIQLTPWRDPNGFGTAAILDILVEWMEIGTKTRIITEDNQVYGAVRISKEHRTVYKTLEHSNPIVSVATKSGDTVFMTMIEKVPNESPFDAIALVEHWGKNLQPDFSWNGIKFPMVDLNQEVNIKWVLGMASDPDNTVDTYIIEQAIQQTKFTLTEIGAHVKSATAIAMVPLGLPRRTLPDHIIDKPFLIWITRDSLNKPLFVGYIDRDVWQCVEVLTSNIQVIRGEDPPPNNWELHGMLQDEMKERLYHNENNL